MSNTVSLDQKVVVVTGSGGRLGGVVGQKLLDAGATVVGLDARPSDEVPDGVHSFVADLTNEMAVVDVFEQIRVEVGPVDGLIHTVGMWGGAPFVETEMATWETMLAVNLTSTFLTFREAAKQMKERGGHLVAITSMQGADRAVAEQGPYSVTKAGVVRLVEAVAAEHDGLITAAAVAPSMILFGGEEPGTKGIPVAEIADLCVTLASDVGASHNGSVVRAYGTMG